MNQPKIETHPWPPFIPPGAKVLILGTFPPPRQRWSMDFYYPNRTNDFWKICGLIFCGDANALYDTAQKQFKINAIKQLLCERGIAIGDTCRKIKRLKGNASDKYLEIVEPMPLLKVLAENPSCHTVVTTGEKAAGVVAAITGTDIPGMGEMTLTTDGIEIWRMPSTSRAYPIPLTQKAEYYERLFRHLGIL